MKLPDLHGQIVKYLQQGLVMEDVRQSAQECQSRIDQTGIKWDSDRMLWRKPPKGGKED